MEYIEISAKTVDEAITEALVKLGTTSDRIEYEIVEKGNNGFLGIGRKDAVIKVRKKYSVNDDIKDFLNKVFEAMDLKVEIVMTAEENSNVINVDLKGDDMGVLIGKRGQTLDSLQYLTNLAVNKNAESFVKVKIDTEDYRKRRRETLENLAKNIAYKVKRTKRPVSLEPMNPYERRVIHSALQNDKYVTTHSEGDEPFRRVVVTLKKYENGGLLYFEDGKLKQTLINPETQVITHNIIYDPNTPNDIYFSILRKDNMTVAFNKEKVLVIKSPNNIIDYTCAVNSYTIYDIHCTENYLYWEKDGDIFRLNLTNGTKEMIFNGAGNYIFYDYPNIIYSKIYVQSDDIVHFRARKLSTGELVAAKIDKGIFSENTINESNNSTIISFIQIN